MMAIRGERQRSTRFEVGTHLQYPGIPVRTAQLSEANSLFKENAL